MGTPGLRSAIGLIVAVLAVSSAAAIGGAATSSSVGEWYQALRKPSFNPPSWIFGPVWTALYAMMATAAWLVWMKRGFADAQLPLALFGLQLALNAAWSVLFFGLRNPGLALVDIGLLWAAILATLLAFRPISLPAALLLAPYLVWVSFAAVLNHAIWSLNR
jgi:tryptophan-rich sensory protein